MFMAWSAARVAALSVSEGNDKRDIPFAAVSIPAALIQLLQRQEELKLGPQLRGPKLTGSVLR
jgi:hypothetical protein